MRRLIVADTITEIHQRSRGTYGRRRVRAALLADYEMNVNHKLVDSIMSEHGLYGLPRPGRRKPNLIGVDTPVDLVNRRFTATMPNQLWCTDITEHPARDGKVYCCAILDCFSRMIVARTFSTTADTALVNNAVNMAVGNRTRSGPTILHADHGPQFTSWSFGENMRRWDLLGSFGTVGDCFDNAAMESFWARLQVELLNTRRWATTIELAAAMADYIDNFYNVERRHSYLGNISPTEFETLWTSTYSISTRITTTRDGGDGSSCCATLLPGCSGRKNRQRHDSEEAPAAPAGPHHPQAGRGQQALGVGSATCIERGVLRAAVRALTAPLQATRSIRMASIGPSASLGAPLAWPARTVRAAASASMGSLLLRWRRMRLSGRCTSSTSTP